MMCMYSIIFSEIFSLNKMSEQLLIDDTRTKIKEMTLGMDE
jgi:hypothetical protein